MFEKIKKLAGEPLAHFLLIGAGIYGLYGMFAAGEAGINERVVTVTSGDIQALTNQWKRTWNRSPTEDEFAGIIRSHVRVQILHREALAMGLDQGDTVIERRLAQKVELLANSLITPEEPSAEALKAWYADNPDRFKEPDLYTITHIFFNPDKREETTLDDAQAVLNVLNSLDTSPSDYSAYGDRFMLQNYYPSRSELELRKLFGTGFVEQVVELEPGIWHGPVLSGYGTHLVIVNDVVLSPPPAYDVVEAQLKEAWLAEQVNELSKRFIDNLIARYEVIVEEADVPVTVPASGAVR